MSLIKEGNTSVRKESNANSSYNNSFKNNNLKSSKTNKSSNHASLFEVIKEEEHNRNLIKTSLSKLNDKEINSNKNNNNGNNNEDNSNNDLVLKEENSDFIAAHNKTIIIKKEVKEEESEEDLYEPYNEKTNYFVKYWELWTENEIIVAKNKEKVYEIELMVKHLEKIKNKLGDDDNKENISESNV